MGVPETKEEALKRVRQIVSSFRINEASYTAPKSKYNETQVRTDYITPLLEAFGWDVYNHLSKPLDLRDVYEEVTVEVGEEKLSKRPDYELRVARQRKYFVEAKKPSVNIEKDISSAFQVRRYGFSASLPISVLTNFKQLAIYDCYHIPSETDEAHVARLGLYSFEEFETKFDELYERISREAVFSGSFDKIYLTDSPKHEVQQFDGHFLRQVSEWRMLLAQDIHLKNKGLSPDELTYIVQLFLSRIIFLRICEDRDIEKYQTLKALGTAKTFESFMSLLEEADNFYDSGLFDLLIDKRTGVVISNEVLSHIIEELYYPKSPYTFAVVEAGVLGEIYELFLGKVIKIDANGKVETIEKPEVRESGGVVPTPQFIVNDILARTLISAINGKSPDELQNFTLADICCGSGVFLLGAFDILLNYHIDWYINHSEENHHGKIYEVSKGQWRLNFEEKRNILLNVIRGVDIDSNAVEIAKFSLLLKLIEGETEESLKAFVEATKEKVLPKLDDVIRFGNSLIEHEALSFVTDGSDLADKVNPFTWEDEFPEEMKVGGFDVIVGNPPYIRIQNMVNYSPEEVALYRDKSSSYDTARSGNFDKYTLFIERSLNLISAEGVVGLIVPNKFMTTMTGEAVRELMTEHKFLKEIVHFGALQVFGRETANYTCTLVLNKTGNDCFSFEKVEDLVKWKYGEAGALQTISSNQINKEPWAFCSESASVIFDKLNNESSVVMGGKNGLADIFVGVQTSNDSVYIFTPKRETADQVFFDWNDQEWCIEREILRPCLHDVVLAAYEKPKANKYMIFPYRIEDGRAHLIQPDEMKIHFPNAWSYLSANKEELEKRNIVGGSRAERQWYQFGRSQSLTKFTGAKIVLPILSLEPKYAFDDQNIVVTGGGNGPYYLVSPKSGQITDLYFLLAILCHPVSEAMVRSRTSVFGGGYYSHGKQFIEHLPVPSYTVKEKEEIASLVRKVIDVSAARDKAILPRDITKLDRIFKQLKNRIEQQVTSLYGLTDEEMISVREVPIPS